MSASKYAAALVVLAASVVLACTSGGTTTPVEVVDHVTITGATSSVPLASEVNLVAYAYGPNNVQLVDRNFSWASSDPATASVAGSGGYALVVPHAAGGPVTITATLKGTTGSTSFTVTGTPTIGLSASSLTFTGVVGGTIVTQSVAVNNTGTGSLTGLTVGPINYLSGSNWITTASFNTTTAPATLTLGVTSGLGAGTYTANVPVTSNASGVTNAPSIFVTLVVAPPLFTQLALTTEPSPTAAVNVPFAVQPVLQLRDANGAAVAQSGAVITATLASGSGTLGGTTTATTNAGGVATFTNLSLGAAGSNTILFSTTASSGTLSVTSDPIVVSVVMVPLTIQVAGAGNGTVTSSPGGISCTSAAGTMTGACSANYSSGTVVTLTATPAGGTFAGWSGACTNISGACQVTMSQAQSVTATFVALGSCPNTTFTLGFPVAGTLTSSCPVFTSYYATYSTVLASAQTIAVSIAGSFDPVALGVQVSSTGSAVGFFGSSPLHFKILAPAGTLTLFPNGYTPGTTGTFVFTASQTSAFVANCESVVLVPGGMWNESLAVGACPNGQFYYDAYVIEIPAGATATATMTSTFGPALALYDQVTSTLITSAPAAGTVSTLQYTNSSGQSAIYQLRATSGTAGLTGPYSLSFALSGPGSLRQTGSSPGGYAPVGAAILVHHGGP